MLQPVVCMNQGGGKTWQGGHIRLWLKDSWLDQDTITQAIHHSFCLLCVNIKVVH